MASAVIGVAILARHGKNAGAASGGMALARLDRHKPFRRKALVLEGSVRIGRKQEGRY